MVYPIKPCMYTLKLIHTIVYANYAWQGNTSPDLISSKDDYIKMSCDRLHLKLFTV